MTIPCTHNLLSVAPDARPESIPSAGNATAERAADGELGSCSEVAPAYTRFGSTVHPPVKKGGLGARDHTGVGPEYEIYFDTPVLRGRGDVNHHHSHRPSNNGRVGCPTALATVPRYGLRSPTFLLPFDFACLAPGPPCPAGRCERAGRCEGCERCERVKLAQRSLAAFAHGIMPYLVYSPERDTFLHAGNGVTSMPSHQMSR